MDGKFMIIAFVIALSLLALLMAKLASFWKCFTEETHYLCHKKEQARSHEEYRRWCIELRCHYLMLIPFVNRKNVMRIYRFFFYKGDHAQKKERGDSLVPLLLPSMLGIGICMVCICGMSWAWFSASVELPAQKITAAYYEVTVDSVRNGDNEITVRDGVYRLTADTSYTVILKATGSVKKCGGYCLIENTSDGTKVYTQTIIPGESITITFTPSVDGSYSFTGVWGSHPIGVTENDIINASTANTQNNVADNPDASAPDEPTTDQITDYANPDSVQSDTVNPNETESPANEPVAEQTSEPVTNDSPITEPITESSES